MIFKGLCFIWGWGWQPWSNHTQHHPRSVQQPTQRLPATIKSRGSFFQGWASVCFSWPYISTKETSELCLFPSSKPGNFMWFGYLFTCVCVYLVMSRGIWIRGESELDNDLFGDCPLCSFYTWLHGRTATSLQQSTMDDNYFSCQRLKRGDKSIITELCL